MYFPDPERMEKIEKNDKKVGFENMYVFQGSFYLTAPFRQSAEERKN